jgi:hypothetical protein
LLFLILNMFEKKFKKKFIFFNKENYFLKILKKKFKKNFIFLGKNKYKKRKIVHNLIQKLICEKKKFINTENKLDKNLEIFQENCVIPNFFQIEFFFKKKKVNLTEHILKIFEKILLKKQKDFFFIIILNKIDNLNISEQLKLYDFIKKGKKKIFFIGSVIKMDLLLYFYKKIFFVLNITFWKNFSIISLKKYSILSNFLKSKNFFLKFSKFYIFQKKFFFKNQIFIYFLYYNKLKNFGKINNVLLLFWFFFRFQVFSIIFDLYFYIKIKNFEWVNKNLFLKFFQINLS